MTKTVIIPDDVHLLIVKKQINIREKYGVTLRISDMVAVGMRNIIDKMDELFNLRNGGKNDGSTENESISTTSDIEEEQIKTYI